MNYTLKTLYDELLQLEGLQDKVTYTSDVLKIVFHKEYKIEVIDKKGYGFCVYINDLFVEAIEWQDIFVYIKDLALDVEYVVMKKKSNIFSQNNVSFVSKQSFENNRAKWKAKRDIKILSTEQIILNNY